MSRDPAGELFFRACAVASPQDWDGSREDDPPLDAASWRRVVALSEEHGFAGLVARNLGWRRDATGFVSPVLSDLETLRRRVLTQNLARKAAARTFCEALGQRDIPFVLFKGVVIAEEIYGDLSLRHFNDFDVMVPTDRLDEAYEAALALGYAAPRFGHVRDYLALGSHSANLPHRNGMGLDLHWSIAPQRMQPGHVALAWSSTRPSVGGSHLPGLRLSNELTLVHLALHFHAGQYCTLKPLIDFHVTARRHEKDLDVAALATIARQLDSRPMVEIAALVCRRFLGASALAVVARAAPPRLGARLTAPAVSRPLLIDAARRSRIGNWLRYLIAAGGLRETLRSAAAAFVPDRLALRQFFDKPYRPGLYPIYYWRQLIKVATFSRK
jgi:hypothetical protein